MKKSDYIKKMDEFRNERKNIYPILMKLLKIYDVNPQSGGIIEDFGEIFTTVSLLDNGYININNFRIDENGGDIIQIVYLGGQPLTDKGYRFLDNCLYEKKRFRNRVAILSIIVITVLIMVGITTL